MRSQLIAAAVLAALPTVAGAQATRRPAEIRFQAMDRNGDRTITRQEWQGSDRSFVVHDWNGDGVLSGEEVRVGARRQRSNAPDYDGGEFYDWTARGFTSVDHNRDGRITRQEWHFDQEGFYRADHNRDGVLTRSEFLGEANTTTTATTVSPIWTPTTTAGSSATSGTRRQPSSPGSIATATDA